MVKQEQPPETGQGADGVVPADSALLKPEAQGVVFDEISFAPLKAVREAVN